MHISEFFRTVFYAVQADVFAQGRNIYLWIPVAFGAGIALYFGLPFEPLLTTSAGIFLLSGFALYDFWKQTGVRLIFFMFFAVCAGFLTAQVRTISLSAPALQHRTKTVETSGIVESVFQKQNGKTSVVLKDVKIKGFPFSETPLKIRVSIPSGARLETGDLITLDALLSQLPLPVYPEEAGLMKRDYFARIGATGYSRKPPLNVVKKARELTFMDKVRAAVKKRLDEKSTHSGLSQALLLGTIESVPEQTIQDYRLSGIAHLLSVSGVHLGLATGTVYAVLSFVFALFPSMALRFNVRKIAAFFAVCAGGFYLRLSGAPVSAQRAFIMVAFVFLALLINRRAFNYYSLAWAALLILIFFPESLLSVGFQLSFAAVLGLICLYGFFSKQSLKHKVLLLILADFAAVGATLPLSLHYFNYTPLYGVLGNLIAAPVAGILVMPFLFSALLLMPFHLERLALTVSDFGLTLIGTAAHKIAHFPYAGILSPSMPFGFALTGMLGVLFFCLWKTKTRYFGIVLYAAGFAGLLTVRTPDFLIDSNASFYAIKDDSGQLRFKEKGNVFAKKVWTAKNAQKSEKTFNVSDETPYIGRKVRFFCENKLCLYESGASKIALARTNKAVEKACLRKDVDILIAPNRTRKPCAGVKTFLKGDFSRYGTHAFYIAGDKIDVVRAKDSVALRPWVPAYGKMRFFKEYEDVFKLRRFKRIKARLEFSPRP